MGKISQVSKILEKEQEAIDPQGSKYKLITSCIQEGTLLKTWHHSI